MRSALGNCPTYMLKASHRRRKMMMRGGIGVADPPKCYIEQLGNQRIDSEGWARRIGGQEYKWC